MSSEPFEAERTKLNELNLAISGTTTGRSLLIRQRRDVIRQLGSQGVKGNQIALWASCDPMEVSRALRDV